VNIKEHIEAGHYPKDEKGRALVPMKSGRQLVVTATDKPGPCPIIGWVEGINHAFGWYGDSEDLLPPPPRKVKVMAYTVLTRGNTGKYETSGLFFNRSEAGGHNCGASGLGIVTLTGEYEEPWSSP